ncbi:ABC transporter ATP-binding protein [Nitratireductor kimnyeongensis]|uniref:ABC transporter ATP-binding protein n=1 Tax=Nitratireductor kimnyeongensis TaxID=430679 RepID=A0ABW0T4B3_9HYPH|nr:ABC transporter ATP-binding protein [Nitratireductor kimnyeongensis]QZZ34769.1 ABC transporter ATP-binding protein [Nitratireductor kimnyeongensis]
MTDGSAIKTGEAVLSLDHLHKAFGALKVTDDVTLDVRSGEIHALIGPNGAGKSTLIAQICGELQSDSGRVHFRGRDLTDLSAFKRARLGLGRSFQTTQLCLEFSVLEHVILSLDCMEGGSFNLFTNPRNDAALREEAMHWIGKAGLAGRENRQVANLAHGERRQLELAVALARKPHVLVLDEPMAGMGAEESARMVDLLQELKGEYPMLLVEHDMDAVFTLADRVSVLVYGRIIFTGTVDEVRQDAEVRSAYLGDEAC